METHPASGTLIAGFEGATNILFWSVMYLVTISRFLVWSVGNIVANNCYIPRSVVVAKDNLYENKLIILNLTSDLDNV